MLEDLKKEAEDLLGSDIKPSLSECTRLASRIRSSLEGATEPGVGELLDKLKKAGNEFLDAVTKTRITGTITNTVIKDDSNNKAN